MCIQIFRRPHAPLSLPVTLTLFQKLTMPWRYNFSARVFRRVYVFFILFNQTPSSHQPAKAVVSLRMWAVPVAVAVVLVVVTFHIIPMPRFGTRHRLRGKHVLITGGSKGLGLSLAKEFVRKGCHVTVVARAQADLLAALQSLDELATSMSLAVKVQALSADTASAEELHRAFETAEKVAGPVDILFCNAGLSKPGLFIEQPIEDFERTMQVNYVGTLRTIKCALPGMLQRRSGHIVITTSVLSVLGFAGYSSYAPSKWALRGLADCLHNEVCCCLALRLLNTAAFDSVLPLMNICIFRPQV